MITSTITSHMELANQGGEYLKCSLLRLHNPLSCYLTPKNVYRFNIVQIWPLT